MRRLVRFLAISAAAALALGTAGCAGPAFEATKAKSKPIVQKLYDDFKLAGYKKGNIGGGGWSPDGGGDPNFYFEATLTTDRISARAQCEAVSAYVDSISSAPLPAVQEKRGVPNCIAELLSAYSTNGGYSWTGTFDKAPLLVMLDKTQYGDEGEVTDKPVIYKLTVSTNFIEGASGLAGCPECFMQEPEDRNLVRYLNDLQNYRLAQGFDYFTEKTIEAAGVEGKTSTTTMTPVADPAGKLTRLKVEWASGRMNVRCYSLMPWSEKVWGMPDPGSPRPMMLRLKLEDLKSFGQYMFDSDCVVDDVFASATPTPQG